VQKTKKILKKERELGKLTRLNQILINDKFFNPTKLNELLNVEIYKTLSNFMEIGRENVATRLDIDEGGNYILRCKVTSKRLKVVGIING